MSTYKGLTKISPMEGQEWFVVSYYLNENPVEKGLGVVDPDLGENGRKTYGQFLVFRGYPTMKEANDFANKIKGQNKVRSAFAVKACSWVPISTVLRLDQVAQPSPQDERSMMKAAAVDKEVFGYKVNLKLTSDLHQRAEGHPARQVTAACHDVLALQEQIDAHRKAILECNTKLSFIMRQLRNTALTLSDWEREDLPNLHLLLSPATAIKLHTLLKDTLVEQTQEESVSKGNEFPMTLDELVAKPAKEESSTQPTSPFEKVQVEITEDNVPTYKRRRGPTVSALELQMGSEPVRNLEEEVEPPIPVPEEEEDTFVPVRVKNK